LQKVIKSCFLGWLWNYIPSLYYQFKLAWLSVIAGLLSMRERKVVPEALQPDLLLRTHEGHGGMQNTEEKSRDLLYCTGQYSVFSVNPCETSA